MKLHCNPPPRGGNLARSASDALSHARRFFSACVLGIALALSPNLHADPAKVNEAKALLERGQPEQAYQILKPLETELAGDPRFDYLLGIAAMDTGRAMDAMFALERAAAVAPEDPLVRVAYANALLGANEDAEALRQEQLLRAQIDAGRQLPDGVLQGLDRYQNALAEPALGNTTDFRGYVGVTLGYDSNVSNATNEKTLFVPGLNSTLALQDGSRRQPDFFGVALAGASVIHPLTRKLTLNGAVSGSHRIHETEHSFETTSLQANADFAYTHDERHRYSIGAFAQHSAVHMDVNRNSFGLIGRGVFKLDARSESSLFLQYTRNEYPQEIRDSNRYIAGVGYRTILPIWKEPVISGRVFFGREEQDESHVPHLGHDVVGASLAVNVTLTEKYGAFMTLAGEQREYLGQDPLFLTTRSDQSYQASAGMTYVPAKSWLVRPRGLYVRNISNVAINDYAFGLVELSVIKRFH